MRRRDLVVPVNNIDALAGAIESLLNDPTRRLTLGEEAAVWAQQFDVDRVFAKFLDLYEGR